MCKVKSLFKANLYLQLYPKGTITADEARLEIVATGLYEKNEEKFMDVQITHPT